MYITSAPDEPRHIWFPRIKKVSLKHSSCVLFICHCWLPPSLGQGLWPASSHGLLQSTLSPQTIVVALHCMHSLAAGSMRFRALLTCFRYKYIFQFPLPIPPPLPPSTSYTNETTGKSIDFYEIDIQDFEKQVYPGLQTTSLTGYNGMAPGPTLHMTRGREAVVRFINKSKRDSSIHLHGYVGIPKHTLS